MKAPFPSSGVLLLNAVLTVRAHQANSHKAQGWETFTDAVIQWLSTNLDGLVFMLWGAYAQKKGASINKVRAHSTSSLMCLSAAYTCVLIMLLCLCLLGFWEMATQQKRHHVLQAVHPSPLSAHRGFFGCKHFSRTNELLKKSGKTPIDWTRL